MTPWKARSETATVACWHCSQFQDVLFVRRLLFQTLPLPPELHLPIFPPFPHHLSVPPTCSLFPTSLIIPAVYSINRNSSTCSLSDCLICSSLSPPATPFACLSTWSSASSPAFLSASDCLSLFACLWCYKNLNSEDEFSPERHALYEWTCVLMGTLKAGMW